MDTSDLVKDFFSSVSNPSEILSSKLVSRMKGTEAIEGGYNVVHILHLDIGKSEPLPFVLRFPLSPENISPWQICTSVGCMLYCQRHPELHIPTPAIYAYNLTLGSEFIAMEYIEGDTLSDVWWDLLEEEKENVIYQVAEMMKSMRAARFNTIGGIDPDGSPCPLVDGVDASNGRVVVDDRGLYDIGPFNSLRGWVGSVFDREFHYMDQMLHKGSLPHHEVAFRNEMKEWLVHLTPEQAFDRIARKRSEFHSLAESPFNVVYPFVLRHGDLHGRNVILSHSSSRRIMAVIDWDFGGSHVFPLADKDFEVISDPEDEAAAEEQLRWQDKIDQLIGELPFDTPLINAIMSIKLHTLDADAAAEAGNIANEPAVQITDA